MRFTGLISILLCSLLWWGCNASGSKKITENLSFIAESESPSPNDVMTETVLGNFDTDSAYSFLAKQVAFGPRVPNTDAHRQTGDWLVSELKRHGTEVIVQNAQIKAFDGTVLKARNIFGQINPHAKERILLLAHWDSRPWADKDIDPQKRNQPVDGANDGASGVAVLLEIARQLSLNPTDKGVDILFVDAEDWGSEGDDESWALGTKYFVDNMPVKNYSPTAAILLDMVGGEDAIFCREYFSERYARRLNEQVWQVAAGLGYDKIFQNRLGGAVTDDHVQLIRAGIPTIDIIEFHPEDDSGFNPRWHTTSDTLDGISKSTLSAVGNTLINFLYH